MHLAELHGKQRERNARSGHEGQYEAWRTRAGAMVGVAACKVMNTMLQRYTMNNFMTGQDLEPES